MELDFAQRTDNKHQEKEKQQRHRSEITDPARQWPRLQLFWQTHADLKSRQQVLRLPREFPAVFSFLLVRRRKRIVREIDVIEIRRHLELKVLDLRDVVTKVIAPAFQPLRAILDVQNRFLTGSDAGGSPQRRLLIC